MKRQTGNTIGVRMDKDVELLVEMATKTDKWRNANRVVNFALRRALTPLFPSKRVAILQAEMKVEA